MTLWTHGSGGSTSTDRLKAGSWSYKSHGRTPLWPQQRTVPLLQPQHAGTWPRADNLNIPPYANVAALESAKAPDRGQTLKDMVEGYAPEAEAAHTLPPSHDTPGIVLMIMPEAGHFYHVRITPELEDTR